PGSVSRYSRSPTITGDEKPPATRSSFHLRWVLVTSPLPVGSTHTPMPPRPPSQYTSPAPSTGDTVSPAPWHHQISLPSSGSTPCSALEAATSSCGLPWTFTSTGVLWLKPRVGRFCVHRSAPVFTS